MSTNTGHVILLSSQKYRARPQSVCKWWAHGRRHEQRPAKHCSRTNNQTPCNRDYAAAWPACAEH